MINRERLVNKFIEMIEIDSPSYEEKDYRDYLIEYFKEKKYSIYIDDAGDKIGGNSGNLLVHIKGQEDGEPICLMAHMDTVKPGRNIEYVIKNNIIKSQGKTILGADDKAGIAAIIEAVQYIEDKELAHPDIYLLFTVCEEAGMLGVKNFDASKLPCKNIVVVDAAGPAGIIAIEAPAKYGLEVTFTGKTAHAGIEPEKGINAVYIAAEAISNMSLGRINEDTTANIGSIVGGSETNIVTDKVTFTAEIRSHDAKELDLQVEKVKKACKKATEKLGGKFEINISKDYPMLKLDKDSYIFNLCLESFKKENIKPSIVKIGGGSDANILAGKGYNCTIISVGMDNVHTFNEMLNIDDMYISTKVLVNIVTSYQKKE